MSVHAVCGTRAGPTGPGPQRRRVRISVPLLGAALVLAVESGHAAREPVDEDDLQQAVAAHNSRVELESQELVCKREAPVGTRIKKTICRNKGLIDREQRDAKRFVNKPRPVPTKE